MSKARFNQETRDFIESLFNHNNYDSNRQIAYLEIRERQMYHYECDCPGCADDSAWNEIIDMLNERKAAERAELIEKAVNIITLSMEYNGEDPEAIREEAEKLSTEELKAYIEA